jgi:hypothetical protein
VVLLANQSLANINIIILNCYYSYTLLHITQLSSNQREKQARPHDATSRWVQE